MLDRQLVDDAMRRALALAERSPAADPNPQVGCVILDSEGRIVAEGWHSGAGTPHAEIDALSRLPESWRDRASELTAVVTLEPCNHTGLTGPCAESLITFGIGSVVYALRDPGPLAAGGADRLRAAGVEVLGGVRETEARRLLATWLAQKAGSEPASLSHTTSLPHAASLSRTAPVPHVTVKWAQTLDGRIAAADGSSRWITGADARADVHRRRAQADAILIGTGTLIADDPALTARDAHGALLVPAAEQPVPVVIGHRSIPPHARVLDHPALAAHGLDAPIRLTGDELRSDLSSLAERGFSRVFVEGGSSLITSILAAGLADQLLVYVAAALLGGPRLAVDELGIESMDRISRLQLESTARLGEDLLVIARAAVEAPGEAATLPPIEEGS
ncbi:bifunctional diaminohydroxyphosphoribosylaminopyrimidine deaminase/5-amino-6-(5-phosphoribosylamino)uracil reductase RibD [Leucobacter sp. GX24907]